MKKLIYSIVAIGAMAVATSCEHKELCYDHAHTVDVEVAFDWQNAPDAAPKSMSVYLFPADGGDVLRYELTDRNGGPIRVPIGHYDALCLNSDTENINYRNTERMETFEVTTSTTVLLESLSSLGVSSVGAPQAEGTEGERVALSPDKLWSDYTKGIELRQVTEKQTITFRPKGQVGHYTVEVKNAENLKYVLGVSGSLSSMAGGLYAGLSQLTDERVTLPFEVTVSEDKTELAAELLTFGHCPSEQTTHELIIYVVLADESKWYYTYDVTDQIHAAQDPYNVHIVLDGLPVPKPIVNGGGFQPDVDDWHSVDVDIEM